jgi:hypothetical protein
VTYLEDQNRKSKVTPPKVCRFEDFNRLKFKPLNDPAGDYEGEPGRRVIDWEKPSENQLFIRLSPREATQVSCHFQVPKDKNCKIEIAVLGYRTTPDMFREKTREVKNRPWKGRFGQWRASCISHPFDIKNDPVAPTPVGRFKCAQRKSGSHQCASVHSKRKSQTTVRFLVPKRLCKEKGFGQLPHPLHASLL